MSISPNAPESEYFVTEAYENAKFGTDPLSGLVISSSGSHIVATFGNTIYTLRLAQLTSPMVEYTSPNLLTCLTFHPHDEIFATGDTEGIIRIWYCLGPRGTMPRLTKSSDKRGTQAPTSVLHWHAHAVGSLAFSSNGAYLLSGGEEAVFVVWQLQSRHKEFVPRVGAPIEHITITPEGSSSEQGYLLSLADGGLTFIDAGSLNVTRTFVQLRRSMVCSATPLLKPGLTRYTSVPDPRECTRILWPRAACHPSRHLTHHLTLVPSILPSNLCTTLV